MISIENKVRNEFQSWLRSKQFGNTIVVDECLKSIRTTSFSMDQWNFFALASKFSPLKPLLIFNVKTRSSETRYVFCITVNDGLLKLKCLENFNQYEEEIPEKFNSCFQRFQNDYKNQNFTEEFGVTTALEFLAEFF